MHAVRTQCKVLYVGNYPNPSFGPFAEVCCSIVGFFKLLMHSGYDKFELSFIITYFHPFVPIFAPPFFSCMFLVVDAMCTQCARSAHAVHTQCARSANTLPKTFFPARMRKRYYRIHTSIPPNPQTHIPPGMHVVVVGCAQAPPPWEHPPRPTPPPLHPPADPPPKPPHPEF